MKSWILLTACLSFGLLPLDGRAEIWDLAADFSPTQNPIGAWSYGWRIAPTDPLSLFTEHDFPCTEMNFWNHVIYPNHEPCLGQNPHPYPVTCITVTLQPHQVFFHPGTSSQSVVRWTAPGDLAADLTVHFAGIDFGREIVSIYENQVLLFSSELHTGDHADFAQQISFHAGDVIDCAVDPIDFYGDAVQIDVTLVSGPPVPVDRTTWGEVKARYR